jgi:hypothetical protein
MDPDRVVVYAWNPLTVLSVAHQGHNDSLSIFLLLTAVWLAGRPGRAGWGAVTALTASVFAKFLTVVAAPALVKKVRWRAWPVGIPVALLLCAPFLSAGGEIFGSLTRFGGELAYNGSIHAVFAKIAGPGSRLLSGLVFVGIAAFVQARIGPDPAVRAAWLIAGMLLVLPTVHSWYFTNLLPFLCLTPWLGWIFLSGTCILPHLAHLEIGVTGEWAEWKGLSLLEYAPLFVWLAWVWLRGKAGQRQGTA